MHDVYVALSKLHSSVFPVSLGLKVKIATALFEGLGGSGPVKVVSGGTVSTTHVWLAGEASTLVAASLALTRKVWLPSARTEEVNGLVQGPYAAASILHSKVPASFELKVKVGVESLEGLGGVLSRVVFGATVSTVKAVSTEVLVLVLVSV